MDWKKFADAVEKNLDKLRAEVEEHNKQVSKAITELDEALAILARATASTPAVVEQHAVLKAQIKFMRMQWEKEYVQGWG